MTATRSTQTPDHLDSFESALLAELRGVVADRRPARRRTRVLTLGGVAASAAAVVGVGFAVGGSSPAFAVHHEADGDIIVTINRLDDAPGLERALAAQGVTADVDYAHPIRMETTEGGNVEVFPLPLPNDGPSAPKSQDGTTALVQRGVPEGKEFTCEFGKGGYVTLEAVGTGYVVKIPHESVLADAPLHITTTETAEHHASLAVSTHDEQCIQIASSSQAADD